jgi:HSP20 family protein
MPSPLPPPVPFSELDERVDNALDRWFSGPRGWLPAIDIVRRNSELVIRADVPGMEPDDVKIEVEDGLLTISGEREKSDDKEDGTFLRRERRCGSFSRSMTLPAGVDPSKIEAKVKHGVAEVTIPLSAGSKKRSVTITPIGG